METTHKVLSAYSRWWDEYRTAHVCGNIAPLGYVIVHLHSVCVAWFGHTVSPCHFRQSCSCWYTMTALPHRTAFRGQRPVRDRGGHNA